MQTGLLKQNWNLKGSFLKLLCLTVVENHCSKVSKHCNAIYSRVDGKYCWYKRVWVNVFKNLSLLWLLDSFPRKSMSFGRVRLETDGAEMENVDFSDVQIR